MVKLCTDPTHTWHGNQSDDAEGRPLCIQCGGRGPANYASRVETCEFCGRRLPDDRVRHRIRQCCQTGHDRDERQAAWEASGGFTAAEFVARIALLSNEADELLADASQHVEPAPEVGCALGALAAAAKVLTMLRECGEPEGWVPILPCEECRGFGQHKLGCSRD